MDRYVVRSTPWPVKYAEFIRYLSVYLVGRCLKIRILDSSDLTSGAAATTIIDAHSGMVNSIVAPNEGGVLISGGKNVL
jgi:hypothetical protein